MNFCLLESPPRYHDTTEIKRCLQLSLVFTAQVSASLVQVPHPSKCLPAAFNLSRWPKSSQRRSLTYPNGSAVSVSLPFESWSSARVLAQIAFILLDEVMDYRTVVWDGAGLNSAQPVNYAAGCKDPDSTTCTVSNIQDPFLHITLETWSFGIRRVFTLPRDVQPTLISVLDYSTIDSLFIWNSVLQAGKQDGIDLNYYQLYDAKYFVQSKYFDSWQQLLSLIPPGTIETCSELDAGTYANTREVETYVNVTGNNDTACLDDKVWFSPACLMLNDTSLCIPLVAQYSVYLYMQLTYWLDFPVAMVKMRDGKQKFDDAYYKVVKSGKFLFGWYQPDDNLLGIKDDFPVSLMLPPYNALEQLHGVYKTGNEFIKPRNYVWRKLPSVDPHVTFLATSLNLYDEDMNSLMAESGKMKNVTSDVYLSSWHVACNWVKQSPAVWEQWIPAICAPGQTADPTLSNCVACPAGFYCEGGIQLAQACPKGAFCPANSSAPQTCPSGLQTTRDKMTKESDCSDCTGDNYLINGKCMSLSVLVISIFLPLAVFLLSSAKIMRVLQEYYLPQDEKLLMSTMEELRSQLLINKKYGFYLSNESVEIWVDKQSITCIQSDAMEAACRLALFQEDFDLFFFDNFCATLCQVERYNSQEEEGEISLQQEKLREWLMSMALVLLDRNSPDQRIQTEDRGGPGSTAAGALYFAQDVTETATVASVSDEEPGARRFRFFLDKFIRAKVWMEDQELFERLREACRENVEAMRADCEARFSQLINSPSGSRLEQLSWDKEDKQIFSSPNPSSERGRTLSSSSMELNMWDKYSSGFMEGGNKKTLHLLRQDSYQVRAIEVDEASRMESRISFNKLAESGEVSCVREDVFISQLQQLASRLNSAFHKAILDIILKHCRTQISSGVTSSALLQRRSSQIFSCQMLHRQGEIAAVFPSCKTVKSMTEKLKDFGPPHPAAVWPLTANVLDPVRMCIICQDAADMLEVVSWLEEHQRQHSDLKICEIVNGFGKEEGGARWRGLKVLVLFEDRGGGGGGGGEGGGGGGVGCPGRGGGGGGGGGRIIGEVQLQDKELFALNSRMCRLATMIRSPTMEEYLKTLEAVEEQ
ncbi:hypothetical protein GUITHDRAFT_112591 [Guillardia theta CCMP2712]|uniref:TNFR-Cys domain-containing protein n=1 Tax=Guillardia theta (strain CCMP2712) TaxID=905079 RepID=L1IZ78_GUITC|nr:hypothetical protein GUITHDRAFT_112591 [Guillardia theta CCMP2712]EKX41377.1 hypothetical protein GUITHDRAFT_112591 [Guillardia theta CCMP2712]|eukprot:XP_005828357.1 hypothetical protein GUITHDRAFT_112591 [Guillardia theta CCMP2712]